MLGSEASPSGDPPERHSPIRALLTHLPSRLESTRPDALSIFITAKQEGLITGRICVPDHLPTGNGSARAPRGPFATADGDIVVPLDFAERLWAVAFALLILADHEGARAMRARGITVEGAPPKHIVAVGSRTLAHAMAGPLWPWPEVVPKPTDVGSPAEKQTHEHLAWWVGRANGVYLDAITYLALHEVSHLVQHHTAQSAESKQVDAERQFRSNVARGVGMPLLSPTAREVEARQMALELEREADTSARDLLLGVGVGETAHLPRGYAAVMACTASIVLVGSFRGLRQQLHPDHDVRLRQLLEAVDASRAAGDVSPPDACEALWRLAAVGMQHAASFWEARATLPSEMADWPSVTDALFDHFEAQKQADT
jgi:hypothetical protein